MVKKWYLIVYLYSNKRVILSVITARSMNNNSKVITQALFRLLLHKSCYHYQKCNRMNRIVKSAEFFNFYKANQEDT